MTQHRPLVDFIGIGAHRSGSTWLFEQLREHPQICLSDIKEVDFFNEIQMFWRPELIGHSNFENGIEWYEAHFGHCDDSKKRGEFSPIYLYDPVVPKRIHDTFPHVRLIVTLRNPIERLFSHYQYTVSKNFHHIDGTFTEVVRREKEFVAHGLYFEHLSRYLQFFPRNQIHVVLFEDIKNKPKEVVHDLYQFVDIDSSFSSKIAETRINTTGSQILKHKLLTYRKNIEKIPGGHILTNTLRYVPFYKTFKETLAYSRSVKLPYGTVDNETREYLLDIYRPDIEKLEILLGRDLSAWKK